MIGLFAIIFIGTTLVFGLLGQYFVRRKDYVKRRIEQFIPKHTQMPLTQNETEEKTAKISYLSIVVKALSRIITISKQQRQKLERNLEGAGISLRAEEFIAIRFIIFAILLGLTLFLNNHFLISIFVALIGWIFPSIIVRRKMESRIAASASQLPQALETMSNGMKSGFSFLQAMQLVGKELPDPLGGEFMRTIKEINIGISLESAFENLLQRLPNKDLEIVVTAVLIQRSTGGNLVMILETIHETISERVRMKEELRALTAQGRTSATIITLLPVALGILLSIMNPGYFDQMFSHPLGVVLLGLGAFSGVLGWLLINKVVTVEV